MLHLEGCLKYNKVMQQTRVRVGFTSVLLLLYFATSAFGVEGAVLCLGEDDHFGIEFVSKCAQSALNAVSPSSLLTQSAPQDDCGPCADVALFSGSAVLTGSGHGSASPPVQAPDSSFFLMALSPTCDECLMRLSSHIAHGNRRNLTSVVLLI